MSKEWRTRGGRRSSKPTRSKGRKSDNTGGKEKMDLDGLLPVAMNLVGAPVVVRVKGGKEWEGIFNSCKPKNGGLGISLRDAHLKGDTSTPPEKILFISDDDFVTLETNHPLGSSNRESGFKTDTQISSNKSRERELQAWDGGDDTNMSLEQNEDYGKGWDQFETNRKLFGVQSTFDENEYTTPIDRRSENYEARAAYASRMAAKIQGTVATNPHMAEERGQKIEDDYMDEEDRYGAVLRDDRTNAPWRKSNDRGGKDARNSPSPASPLLSPQVRNLNLDPASKIPTRAVVEDFLCFKLDQPVDRQGDIQKLKEFQQNLEKRSPTSSPKRTQKPSRNTGGKKQNGSSRHAQKKAPPAAKVSKKALTLKKLNPNAMEFTPGQGFSFTAPRPQPKAAKAKALYNHFFDCEASIDAVSTLICKGAQKRQQSAKTPNSKDFPTEWSGNRESYKEVVEIKALERAEQRPNQMNPMPAFPVNGYGGNAPVYMEGMYVQGGPPPYGMQPQMPMEPRMAMDASARMPMGHMPNMDHNPNMGQPGMPPRLQNARGPPAHHMGYAPYPAHGKQFYRPPHGAPNYPMYPNGMY
mmetsp:Transcript_25564/g.28437  ORF Transcript_25564/g.28437 Transcript_25564/m.28437 type:complete len:582 (+) Transcript_25564:20-1765(+)